MQVTSVKREIILQMLFNDRTRAEGQFIFQKEIGEYRAFIHPHRTPQTNIFWALARGQEGLPKCLAVNVIRSMIKVQNVWPLVITGLTLFSRILSTTLFSRWLVLHEENLATEVVRDLIISNKPNISDVCPVPHITCWGIRGSHSVRVPY